MGADVRSLGISESLSSTRTSSAGRLVTVLAVCLLFAGTSCFGGGGPQPAGDGPEAAGPKKKKKKDAGPSAAPQPKQTSEYSYNPIGKRDPFRSFTSIEVVRPDRIVASELQNWELDQLLLVAILWGIDEPVAMVEDPKGKGHIIHHGDLIGKKWGRVTQIKSDEVVVTEEFRDPIENRPITNEYSMKLPDPYEESE